MICTRENVEVVLFENTNESLYYTIKFLGRHGIYAERSETRVSWGLEIHRAYTVKIKSKLVGVKSVLPDHYIISGNGMFVVVEKVVFESLFVGTQGGYNAVCK